MQLYTILSPCNYIPYYPHANLYPIIPMQIYTLLSPCKSIPYYPHGMITPPFPVLPIFTTTINRLGMCFVVLQAPGGGEGNDVIATSFAQKVRAVVEENMEVGYLLQNTSSHF